MEPTKICSKCGTKKPLSDFYFRKDAQKYRSECIACRHPQNPERTKTYRESHATERKLYGKKYREEHATERRAAKLRYVAARRLRDPNFKIRLNLRVRICDALNEFRKSARTMELLGCSIEFLRQHLEKQFAPGMTWENYSPKGWHIDHIRPCAKFDLSDPEQQRQCFHYTNLQPLWAIDNIKKGAKHA